MKLKSLFLVLFIITVMGSVFADTEEVLNLTAYASTEYTSGGRFAVNAINGSGLTSEGGHSISAANMWSAVDGSANFHWFKVKLTKAERLVSMHMWNGNWVGYTNRGINAFEIFYANTSTDLSTVDFANAEWQSLREDNLTEATGSADYTGEEKSLALLPDSVNWIAFKITSSHGGTTGYAMLSELKLYSGTVDNIPNDTISVPNDTVVIIPSEDLILPSVFGDKMLVQQEDSIAFWGVALAQQNVVVSTSWNEKDSIISDEDGQWKLYIKTPLASFTPHTISVATSTDTVDYTDVLVGEVWLCAGQSNMAFGMSYDDDYSQELTEQEGLALRYFNAPAVANASPQFDIEGAEWLEASSDNLSSFSAVAYYFGKHLVANLENTPVGLIRTAYGSATAESFMSKETLLSKTYLAEHYNSYSHSTPSKNPSWCYNAMIHPLLSYAVKGTIWYQGEANCVRASEYKETMSTLIESWRTDFDNADMPFYLVQLPPYTYSTSQQESGDAYSAATLRQAQTDVSNDMANSGLIVTMDLGDESNIHPTHKAPVGERLGNLALSQSYAFANAKYSGPVLKSYVIEGEVIRLSFDEVDEGIIDQYAELNWFCIAGSDKIFYQGNAFVDGNDIVVSSPFVETPLAVRYAWHNAATPNFFNTAGLPALPFKTDDWETFSYTSSITSWSSLPDISGQAFDLTVPALTTEAPAPGKRVKQTLASYSGTDVYHTLYLPTNWSADKQYPVIVEYAGNGPYINKYGDVCTGKPDDAHLGYGISGGEDFIWISMPFVSEAKTENQLSWWGDIEASVDYTINTVKDICENYGGDSNLVFVTGFSRGAIACNYIGLHNDEIADLWCASIPCSHYDGINVNWGYPDCDEASAITRLERLAGRPQLVAQEGGGTSNTRAFIENSGVAGDYSYVDVPLRNHDDRWLLQNRTERQVLRTWVKDIIEGEAKISAPSVVENSESIDVSIAFKGKAPWSLSYSINGSETTVENITINPYVFSYTITEETSFKIESVSDVEGLGKAGDETTTYIFEDSMSPYSDGMTRQTQNDGDFASPTTEVKYASSWQRKSFFSFGIDDFQSDSVLACAFKVYLQNSSANPFELSLAVSGIDVDHLDESSMIWENTATLELWGQENSLTVTQDDLNSFLTFDVTAYLNSCLEQGKTKMTLCLHGTESTSALLYFNTIESVEFQPKIQYVCLSTETALKLETAILSYKLYPNPSKGSFIVENISQYPFVYSLFNTAGVLMSKGELKSKQRSVFSDLTSGLYFFSSPSETQKVVVL